MRATVYKQILRVIDEEEFDFEETLKVLREKFPKERDVALCSILAQEHQKRVKRTYNVQTSAHKRKEIHNQYKEKLRQQRNGKEEYREGIIVNIAKQNKFSAVLTARSLLAEHLREKEISQGAASSSNSGNVPKAYLAQLLKDTTQIEDKELSYEVFKATLKDQNYGFLSECVKSSLGAEYERRLKRHLRRLNLGYQDEHELRAAGYDKTPDVKLNIPIAVNGSIVNWIESKALFGDDENHTTYLTEQLWSYWNRFGPGLVIYWGGFLDHLEWSAEHGILVRDSFPTDEEIVEFNPLVGIWDDIWSDPDDEEEDDEDEDKLRKKQKPIRIDDTEELSFEFERNATLE